MNLIFESYDCFGSVYWYYRIKWYFTFMVLFSHSLNLIWNRKDLFLYDLFDFISRTRFFVLQSIFFVKSQSNCWRKKCRTMWCFFMCFCYCCCWFGNLTLIHNTKVISFNFISTINEYLITNHWSKSHRKWAREEKRTHRHKSDSEDIHT